MVALVGPHGTTALAVSAWFPGGFWSFGHFLNSIRMVQNQEPKNLDNSKYNDDKHLPFRSLSFTCSWGSIIFTTLWQTKHPRNEADRGDWGSDDVQDPFVAKNAVQTATEGTECLAKWLRVQSGPVGPAGFNSFSRYCFYLSLIFVWNFAVILERVVVELILELFLQYSKGNNMQ